MPVLTHFRDEKTESEIVYNVCCLICYAVDVFSCLTAGVALYFTVGVRKYVVYVSYYFSTTGKVMESSAQGFSVSDGKPVRARSSPMIPATRPSPPASYHRHVPISLLYQPVNSQYHISISQPTQRRCCLCLPTAPDWAHAGHFMWSKAREATTQACGHMAPLQGRPRWQARSSSMDLPMPAPVATRGVWAWTCAV